MALKVTTAPVLEPVDLADLKTHLRLEIDVDDFLVESYLTAARTVVEENILSRALITQTLVLYLDAFPARNTIRLPRPPLQSVTSIVYTDKDGNDATLASSKYGVDTISSPGRIVLNSGESWPGDALKEFHGVAVTYVAGYGDNPTDVPANIRAALQLMVGDLYENREDSVLVSGATFSSLPAGVQSLLRNDRMWPGLVDL